MLLKSIKIVFFPVCRIVFNIFRYSIKRFIIADDYIIKRFLPFE